MAAELLIAPEAAQDIDEAYGWYECQRAGLGEEFLHCVDACVQAICRCRKCTRSCMRITGGGWYGDFRTPSSTSMPAGQ